MIKFSLKWLLESIPEKNILQTKTDVSFNAIMCSGITTNSADVLPNDIFVALKGQNYDGRNFIEQAISKGASAIIVETEYKSILAVPVINIPKVRDYLLDWAYSIYATYTNQLSIIAVTGTNGKTSCCWLMAQLLEFLTIHYVLAGTLGKGCIGNLTTTRNTTMDVLSNYRFLASASIKGAQVALLETSSHGLEYGRVARLPFLVGIYTGLSRDHMDHYHSLDEYAHAKLLLFSQYKPKYAVINLSDTYSNMMITACGQETTVWTFSIHDTHADVYATNISYTVNQLSFTLRSPWGSYDISAPLVGEFNIANLLASFTALVAAGYAPSVLAKYMNDLSSVPGRMEAVQPVRDYLPSVFVDYAHTPDALDKALTYLKRTTGKLWCIVGCGGDRDKGKRAIMGAIAAQKADQVVLTSDNPRSEDPETILQAMLSGITQIDKVQMQISRAQAIFETITKAGADDIVLIAGKGHETYQEIKGVFHDFDDRLHAQKALLAREQNYVAQL